MQVWIDTHLVPFAEIPSLAEGEAPELETVWSPQGLPVANQSPRNRYACVGERSVRWGTSRGLLMSLALSFGCHGAILLALVHPPQGSAPVVDARASIPIELIQLDEPPEVPFPMAPTSNEQVPIRRASVSAKNAPTSTAPAAAPPPQHEKATLTPHHSDIESVTPTEKTEEGTAVEPGAVPEAIAASTAPLSATPASIVSTPAPNDAPRAVVVQKASQEDRQRYFAALRRAIEGHKVYPMFARRRKLEGTVVLGFSISSSGRLMGARVTRSSGHSVLDDASLDAIRAASNLPMPPANMIATSTAVEVPVVFRLSR